MEKMRTPRRSNPAERVEQILFSENVFSSKYSYGLKTQAIIALPKKCGGGGRGPTRGSYHHTPHPLHDGVDKQYSSSPRCDAALAKKFDKHIKKCVRNALIITACFVFFCTFLHIYEAHNGGVCHGSREIKCSKNASRNI